MPRLFLNRVFRKTGPPIHLIWFITAKCNLRCSHCFYYSQSPDSADDLTLDEIGKTISNMAPLLSVSLTGGDPFLRKDLVEIVKLFCQKNLSKNIVLFSNGFDTGNILSTTERILSNRFDSNLFVGVSIDGNEGQHDKYRNKIGSYRNAIATIGGLKKLKNDFSNLNIGVGITFHNGNQDIIKDIVDDIHAKFGIIPGITLIRGDVQSPGLKDIDMNIYKKTIESIDNHLADSRKNSLLHAVIFAREKLGRRLIYETFTKQSRSYDCYAGSLLGVIYNNGDVYPCEMLKEANLGNLRDYDYDIHKIWSSEKADNIRKRIKARACFCTYECQYTCNTLYNIKFSPYLSGQVIKYLVNRKMRNLFAINKKEEKGGHEIIK